jgi:hypothetical protein
MKNILTVSIIFLVLGFSAAYAQECEIRAWEDNGNGDWSLVAEYLATNELFATQTAADQLDDYFSAESYYCKKFPFDTHSYDTHFVSPQSPPETSSTFWSRSTYFDPYTGWEEDTCYKSGFWAVICPADFDNDNVPNDTDNCPNNCNSQQLDADEDGIGDVCDTEDDGCDGCGVGTICEVEC